jgi:hypothetical protein
MNVEQRYVYSVFLPTGVRLTQYTTTNPPPSVGEVIDVNVHGTHHDFEVLSVDQKTTSQYKSVILNVRPVLP